MNKITLLRLLILSSLIISIFSCKKDADYLDKYTGSFTFTITVHRTVYIEDFDTTYTSTVNGQITRYDENLYAGNLKNTYRRLVINFGEVIIPEVLESGAFVSESSGGADYSFSGNFFNSDVVQFEISSQSAGFSASQQVSGKRN